MTGLNIAIVKLQSFLKAQEEVQRRWVERAVKRSEAKLPGLAVEEDVIPEFRKDVKKECQSCLDGINNDKMWCWSFWSRWAIRMSMIGFLCMAFQYSAGILVLPMAAPIVATWLLSRTIRDELFTEMSGVDRRLIPVYRDKLKKVANEKGKEAGAAIQEAEKAEQVAGAREGRS